MTAAGYPWAREITIALKKDRETAIEAGFFLRNPSVWEERQNELALFLLSKEAKLVQKYPEVASSKWNLNDKPSSLVITVCINRLRDISRHERRKSGNPTGRLQSTWQKNRDGESVTIRIPDSSFLSAIEDFESAALNYALNRLKPQERDAIEQHYEDLPDTSGLSVEGRRTRRKRAEKRLVFFARQYASGIALDIPFFRLSGRINEERQVQIAARLELFPGWAGRRWDSPPRCPQGVMNFATMGEPAPCCSFCTCRIHRIVSPADMDVSQCRMCAQTTRMICPACKTRRCTDCRTKIGAPYKRLCLDCRILRRTRYCQRCNETLTQSRARLCGFCKAVGNPESQLSQFAVWAQENLKISEPVHLEFPYIVSINSESLAEESLLSMSRE
jgi:hypothetical protein